MPSELPIAKYVSLFINATPSRSSLDFLGHPIPVFAGISPDFKIAFYAGRYDDLLLGIVPVGNPMDCIARAAVDVVILEEPEHLAWFHCGPQWTSTFKHVVSVTLLC